MKIIFMGTPDFAVPSLQKLHDAGYEIVAVISQPDREKDRKGNILPTPVKACAAALGLQVLQFESVNKEIVSIKELKPSLIITAAFGQLLSDEFLTIAPVFNVHSSLLPLYRGSSPIQSAILRNDKYTGITIMKTVKEMDAGDIVLKEKVAIDDNDTYSTLSCKLSTVGGKALIKAVEAFENHKIKYSPQDGRKATYTKKILRQDGLIDWDTSASEINRKIRAFYPWPSAFIKLNSGEIVKIHASKVHKTAIMSDIANDASRVLGRNSVRVAKNGDVFISKKNDRIFIKCKKDVLELISIQLAGKSVMAASDFLRGNSLPENLGANQI